MLLSMLTTPKFRRALGDQLAGRGAAEDPSVRGPLSRIDWIAEDGEVDLVTVRAMGDSVALMRSSAAILEVPQLEELPAKADERIAVSQRIVTLIFERLGTGRVLGEPELNAALTMFTKDAALVRRDAVDSGMITRPADGAQYRLAPTPA